MTPTFASTSHNRLSERTDLVMKKALCIILVFAACVCCFASCAKNPPKYDLPPVEETTQTYLSAVVTDIPDEDTLTVDVYKEYQKHFGKAATVKLGKIYSDDISIGEEVYIKIDKIEGENYFTIYAESVITLNSNLSAVITGMPDKDTLTVDICEKYQKYFGKTATVKLGKIYSDDISIGEEVYIDIDRIEGEIDLTIYAKSVITRSSKYPDDVDKPVIYLYPEEETVCSVKVELDGELTCTYPEHGENGWQNFTARPDGTLIFPDGKEYYCLYWEGISNMKPDLSKGFCVKGEDTADFLTEILPKIGLTPREANEFIIYWLPLLQENEYNLISFQREAYTDVCDLIIDPMPDSLLRVFMTYKPLTKPIEIEPQEFGGFIRKGFTVVEWGGGIIK